MQAKSWTAVAVKGDRLKRWEVLEDSAGTGKIVVAEHIRTEAYARLIAAAPDLLEALQACVFYAISGGDEWVADKAQAALTKATEEQ